MRGTNLVVVSLTASISQNVNGSLEQPAQFKNNRVKVDSKHLATFVGIPFKSRDQ